MECLRRLLWPVFLRTVAAGDHVFVAVGGHVSDLGWIDVQQEQHGVTYKPVFVNPHPNAGNLDKLIRERGGEFYQKAAWTSDDLVLQLHMTMDPLHRGGLDSVLQMPGRHVDTVNVTTVDLARVMEEHTSEGDVVVMRMDVEGSEYELLRHLFLKGLLCRLARLYVEAHAMTNPKLNSFRPFDVVLPWLLAPCGTEVYVDSNYHSVWESREIWVRDDGACRECPLLYAGLPGAGTACPTIALPQCFDETFTCERCCNTFENGVRGDDACWSRAARGRDSKILSSGGRGYPVPSEVLRKIGRRSSSDMELVESLAGEAGGRPPIFSYEMCCAGMLPQIMPRMMELVARQGDNEAYHEADPRFYKQAVKATNGVYARTDARVHKRVVNETAQPGQPPRCVDISGVYADSGGGTVSVVQSGCSARASNPLQQWIDAAVTVVADKVQLWQLEVSRCFELQGG